MPEHSENTQKQLNKLVGQRGTIKGKFTRCRTYLESVDPTESIDELRIRNDELTSLMENFDRLQEEIESLDTDNTEQHEAERSKMETIYYKLKATITKLISGTEKKNPKFSQHKDNAVRLPKFELPTFSGEIREWPSFKNLFECATSNDLTQLQKLQYLKSCLKGEAATLISSLLLTEENYDNAMEILVNRYENKSIVINYHLKNFLNFPVITRNNPKEFSTTLQQSLDSLTALALPVKEWDVLLVYLITQKLDNSLRAAWELNRKEISIPTLQELKDFFKLRATAFEMMNDRQETIINIQDSTGNWHTVRALLDNGSEVNLVTHRLASILNCKYYHDNQVLQGVGNLKGQSTELCINTNIGSPVSNFKAYDLEFSVLDTITVPLPHNYIDFSKWNIPTDLILADPNFHTPQDIDVLLGGELFFDYILSGKIKLGPKKPMLVETVFGWLVAGKQVLNSNQINSTCNTVVSLHMTSQPNTEDLLSKFWQQEEVKPRDVFTPEQKYCEELFTKTIEQDSSGHYLVEMPINKNKLQELGESFNIAYRSLLSLEARFIKNPELQKQYTAFIHELLDLGHAELVPDFQQQTGVHCYLPHLGVLRPESVSTKLRSVVNGSVKTATGVALNDVLYEGPNIYNDILDIILKFRTYKYAFTCDIIKMFRTILIKSEQRPLLRILWRDSKSEPLQCLQFKTVIYGTKCAPYLACRTLKHMAQKFKQELPEAADIVETQSYMDDFLSGRDTIEQTQEACRQLIELLGRGKFSLHKWSANDSKVLEGVTNLLTGKPEYDFNSPVKTLGIIWNTTDDTLSISVPDLQTLLPTKRNVLSSIAQIYDPLGILQPVVIKAKILIQEIWKANIDWDQVLPVNLLSMWQEFFHGLSYLKNIKTNRYYFSDIPLQITLLGFCDSSERAYGGCIYLKATYLNRRPTCSLVIAKTKVAPIKKQSLPRLELCGALMLAQLYTRVTQACKNKVIHNILLFTDSMIVLHWIKSPYGRKLHTYVSHRLMEIVELTKPDQWNYINTKSNPADMLTRGIQPEMLEQNSFWFSGPQWVLSDLSELPCFEPPVSASNIEHEKVLGA